MLEKRNPNETRQEHYERHMRVQEYLKRKEQEFELWCNPLYREMKFTQAIIISFSRKG